MSLVVDSPEAEMGGSQGHSVLLPLTVSMAAWRCSARCSKPSTGLKPRRHRSVNVALRKARAPAGRGRHAVLKAIQENRMTLPG